MKNNYFSLFIICLLSLNACGPSRTVSFNVTRPAEISMPAEAKTILLVDRTKYKNQTMNVIEGILTGELPGDDRFAVQEAMNALKNTLYNSPRFSVKVSPERLEGNSLSAVFPEPLKWEQVSSLCSKENAEILVALEVFDSDFIVIPGSRIKMKMVGEGNNKQEVEYKEFYAQGAGSVDFGIRTYYLNEKKIVDQQMVSEDHTWEGTGSTPVEAMGLLISKNEAIRYLANNIGESYAYKISPMPIRISRSFYSKSKRIDEVATGARLADVNKWQEAIDIWKSGLSKPGKQKDKGHIAYNIAIGYEVLGEYGTALKWAQDSYTLYGNKEGRNYVRFLQQRINEETILKEQMNK